MPEDWEPIEEEEEPESLCKKWEAEEFAEEFGGKKTKLCPHCRKLVEEKSFSCIYCGETIFKDSGPLGRLAQWASGGTLVFIVLLIIASFFFLSVIY